MLKHHIPFFPLAFGGLRVWDQKVLDQMWSMSFKSLIRKLSLYVNSCEVIDSFIYYELFYGPIEYSLNLDLIPDKAILTVE